MWERYQTSKGKIRWFFEIKVDGTTICSRCGPVGKQAMTVRKTYPEADVAKAYKEMIEVRAKEGYKPWAAK